MWSKYVAEEVNCAISTISVCLVASLLFIHLKGTLFNMRHKYCLRLKLSADVTEIWYCGLTLNFFNYSDFDSYCSGRHVNYSKLICGANYSCVYIT
jgi:hypothetical protein